MAWILVSIASSLLGGSADRRISSHVSVAYIGAWEEEADPVFARFRKALSARHPDLSAAAIVRHFRAEAGDEAGLDAAIRAALAIHPSVLVTPTGEDAKRAVTLSEGTPVVFSSYADPVAFGLRDSLQRSKRPIAGLSLADTMDAKRLELLRDAFPWARRVAVLADRSWATTLRGAERIDKASVDLGLHSTLVLADNPAEVDTAFSTPAVVRYDAWYVPATAIAYDAEAQIIQHLQRLKVPAIHATVSEVKAGALMAYEHDSSFVIDAMVDLVKRICDGEPAGDIPIQTPHRLLLAVRVPQDPQAPSPSVAIVRRADMVFR